VSNWPVVRLSEVALVGAGNAAPQGEKLFENGTVPFIRTSDVGQIRFGNIASAQDLLNQEGQKGLRLWPVGTILFPKSGASTFLNHRVMMDVEASVASHLATIVAKSDKIIPKFLLYFLHTIRAQDLTQDQNYPSLRLPDIGAISVPLPPVVEQRRVVAVLDEAFEAILKVTENAERNVANAQELFDSTLKMTISKISSVSQMLTLAEIARDFGRGRSRHRPRNDASLYGGKYPFIQTGDVRNSGHLIQHYTQTYNDKGLAQSKLWPKETICITIAANIAETGVLTFDACFPDSVIGVVAHPAKALSGYVEYVIRYFKAVLQAEGKGSAQDNINLGTFENARFPFPSLAVQQEVFEKLLKLETQCERLISSQKTKISELSQLKSSLLHRAFSGQLTGAEAIAA
jgi:type I restriction enzyme S subunit